MADERTKAFITGADRKQEWLIKWWVKLHRKHNPDIPLMVCDFGDMSEQAKAWTRENVDTFIELQQHSKCAWFLKPEALVRSPYDVSCWLDLDCEIVAPMDDIFDKCPTGKIGVTIDVIHSKDYHATGLVVADKGNEWIKTWRDESIKATARGDQEAFRALWLRSPEFKKQIHVLDPAYQWLRLQLVRGQDNKNKRLIHWTGPVGKAHIKDKLMTKEDFDFTI